MGAVTAPSPTPVSRRAVAEAAERLAAPSPVVRGVLELLDADASARPVAARLAQSPEIASHVLRLASTAAHGGPAESLEAAVVRIGDRMLRGLLLAASTYRLLEGPLPLYGLPRLALVRHCTAVAEMAQALCATPGDARRGGAVSGRAYLAGLMHDLGKPILAQAGAAGDARVLSVADERGLLGADHAQVGGWIVRRWGIGDDIAVALERHHAAAAPESPVARAVWLADIAVHAAAGELVAIARLPEAAQQSGLGLEALESLLSGGPTGDAPPPAHDLTARELEVLRALATGAAPKQVARELGCSPSTVHNHLHHVYRKLGVSGQAQALLLAREQGWV